MAGMRHIDLRFGAGGDCGEHARNENQNTKAPRTPLCDIEGCWRVRRGNGIPRQENCLGRP